jgi:hypothetical protein
VEIVHPTIGPITQPTCLTATGSFTITNYNSSYTYVVTPSAGVSISGNTITAPTGSYTVIATLGACSSVACASVTVNAQPAQPNAATLYVTQPTCTIATGTIVITAPTGTGLTYSINNAAYQSGVSFGGLSSGNYSVRVKNAAGCISVATVTIINTQPSTLAQVTVGSVTQPTCSTATGSFTITNYNSSYTYVVTPSAVVSISGNTITAPAGTYTVTATLGACSSVACASVTVNAQPSTPAHVTVGEVTQPTCLTATGSFAITNYNSSYTYVVTPSAGVSISGNTITAPAGTYTVTATLGACTSVACASVTVNAQPFTPAQVTVGSVTQPTCLTDTGSFTITNYNSSYTYVVTPSAGVSISGNTITAPTGTYTVTATLGACSSVACASVTVNTQPFTPAHVTLGEVTQPTCSTATGSFTITNYNSSYTYVVTPSAGVSISGNTITAPAGSYTVTATLGACTSVACASVTVNTQPAQLNAATLYVTQPTCTTATGTIVITAPTGTGLTYSINDAAYQSGVSFGGLSSGNYSVRVKNAVGCISVEIVTIIHAQPATPAQVTLGEVTQPTCSTITGSFSITNYNSSYTYVVTPSDGVSISGNTVTAPEGVYTVTATLGTCTSIASETITVGLVARFVLAVNLSPNPYTENFSLSLTTCSDEKVSVIVYDMAGKLIEQLEIYPKDAVSLKIGNRYSTGVYNIIVKQGSEMQILRAVKR